LFNVCFHYEILIELYEGRDHTFLIHHAFPAFSLVAARQVLKKDLLSIRPSNVLSGLFKLFIF
jgi:hypothetical protein